MNTETAAATQHSHMAIPRPQTPHANICSLPSVAICLSRLAAVTPYTLAHGALPRHLIQGQKKTQARKQEVTAPSTPLLQPASRNTTAAIPTPAAWARPHFHPVFFRVPALRYQHELHLPWYTRSSAQTPRAGKAMRQTRGADPWTQTDKMTSDSVRGREGGKVSNQF